MRTRVGVGQASHRFLPPDSVKLCVLGGVIFSDIAGFNSNSDGDVVLHAICNAISSLTGTLTFGDGEIAELLYYKDGITDSAIYLAAIQETLGMQCIVHVSIAIEAKKPKFNRESILQMRQNIASMLHIDISEVGITATCGEGLTDFGCGDGVQAFAIVTAQENFDIYCSDLNMENH